MAKFIENESYKHKLAKELLVKWLTDANDNPVTPWGRCVCCQFEWYQNHGVHTELKFYENSDQYYFENPPEVPGRILFVPDIVVFHKGVVGIIIEVVHSNPLSAKKLKDFRNFFGSYPDIYEIEAEEILRQTKIPEKLKVISQHP